MKFLIRGVRRDDGKDIPPFVHTADSEAQAQQYAIERGILVTSIEKYYESETIQALPKQSVPKERKYSALATLSAIYRVVGALNIVAVFFLTIVALNKEQVLLALCAIFYGAISSLFLFAMAELIELAIDVEGHLRAIRGKKE